MLMTGAILAPAIYGAKPALACSADDTYIGSICSFSGNFCPENYLPADGREIIIKNKPLLFGVIGYKFGGTETVSFKLPDLRGRTPVGYGVAETRDLINIGKTRGTETVTLTKDTLPNHTHNAMVPNNTSGEAALTIAADGATADTPLTAGYLARPPYDALIAGANSTGSAPIAGTPSQVDVTSVASVGTTGGGQPIPIESPYTVMNFCIRAIGLYPSRN